MQLRDGVETVAETYAIAKIKRHAHDDDADIVEDLYHQILFADLRLKEIA